MKNGSKILLLIIVLIITVALPASTVFAEVQIIGADQLSTVTLTAERQIQEGENNTAFRKYVNGTYNAYCISGYTVAVKLSDTCNYAGYSVEYAAIINEANNGSTGDGVNDGPYAVAQLALGMFTRNDRNYCPDNGEQCQRAREIYDSAISGSLKNEIDRQKSGLSMANTQPFSLNSSNNYVAKFTVSGGMEINSVSNCSVKNHATDASISGATTRIDGAVVTVTIPQSSVSAGITQVDLSCSAARDFYASQYFTCSDGYQNVALARDRWRETGKVSSSANLTKEQTKGNITITKRFKNSYESTAKKLPGAKFKIKNSSGKTINASGVEEEGYIFTTDSNGEIKVTNIEIPDTTKSYKYTVEEISTLSGYARILGEKEITLNSANNFSYTNPSNEFVNETVKVKISKTDATGKKELPGAKLSLLDKDGKILKKCVFDKDKNLITYSDGADAKDCTWVSTDKEQLLEGLPIGKYYLVEDLAPEGYKKSSEKILIEIKDTGAVKDKVEMKNTLEVPVPDTLSARSALLLAVAMFDVALGIGIVTYVKKNKIEE